MIAFAEPLVYHARGGAAKLFRTSKAEVLIDGPAGTGKTRAVLERCHQLADNYPGARILLVRKTRASMTESVLQIFESKVLPTGAVLNPSLQRNQRQAYHYPNGADIVCGGLDNVERVMSTEYDVIALFEGTEATENDLEKLGTRLRNNAIPRGISGGPRKLSPDGTWAEPQAQETDPVTGRSRSTYWTQIIVDCNPSWPSHWLKLRADSGGMARILSRHADNPTLTPEYLERLSHLSGHRRARLFMGQWAAAEGLVYDHWDEAVFVRDRKAHWQRVVISVDEGYANPASVGFWLVDNDGYPHRADEFYHAGQLESAVVGAVRRFGELAKHKYEFDLEAVIVDPAAAKLIAALEEAGFPVQGADNDVLPGIASLQERFTLDGQGRPRITISPKCRAFIGEIASYQWAQNRDGSKQDKPQKVNDHACDESRYFSRYLDTTCGSMEVRAV